MRRYRSVLDLIELLHIDRIGAIEAEHKMIRESYKVKKYTVESYEEFLIAVVGYYQYHSSLTVGRGEVLSAKLAEGYVSDILDSSPLPSLAKVGNMLGAKDGGFKIASANAQSGRHGGLPGVIDAVAQGMSQKAVRQYIDAVFLRINPQDYDIRVSFMMEYLKIFGAVLLRGEDCMSPYELANNMQVVLENHMKFSNDFRKVVQ